MSIRPERLTPIKKGRKLLLVGALAVLPQAVAKTSTPDEIKTINSSETADPLGQQVAQEAGSIAITLSDLCLPPESEDCNQANSPVTQDLLPLSRFTPQPTLAPMKPSTTSPVAAATTTTTTTTVPRPVPAVASLTSQESALIPEIEAQGVPPESAEMLSCIAWHESNDIPTIVNAEGYAGLFQFGQATWAAHGGQGTPASASEAYQIKIAYETSLDGWEPWNGDVCLSKVS